MKTFKIVVISIFIIIGILSMIYNIAGAITEVASYQRKDIIKSVESIQLNGHEYLRFEDRIPNSNKYSFSIIHNPDCKCKIPQFNNRKKSIVQSEIFTGSKKR